MRETQQDVTVMDEAHAGSGNGGAEIDMVEAKEMWSEYRLSDGTRLRVKPVMIAVFRAEGEQTPEGEPIYNMKSTLITDVRASSESQRSH